jgi:serine/threonine protein kinase
VEAISRIFSDVTRALACCHSYGICHRDIKPENIIVDQDYTTKVLDFGSACPRTELRKQNVGTLPFIAPECMLGTAQDGGPCDVWSVGIVLMEMMFGLKALSKALGWDSSFPSTEDCGRQLLSHFADSGQGVTFIRTALSVEVFCQRGVELLASMLLPDPHKRPTMQSLQTFTF